MTAASRRLLGLDVARFFAILGMVLVNYRVVMSRGDRDPAWLAWLIGSLEGKAAATFVVLAGVGVSLLSARGRRTGDPELLARARFSILRRALFLFALGLSYTPLWPGDILHFYGVYLVLAVVVLRWPDKLLLALAALVNAGFFALLVVGDYERGWNWETLEYSGLFRPDGMLRHLFFNGFHPVLPWAGFLFVGMWLGRRNLRSAAVRRATLAWGLGLFAGGVLVSETLVSAAADSWMSASDAIALFGTAPMPPNPFYFAVGLGTALTAIGGCLLVERRFGSTLWFRALAATGQLSLTLYAAHVILGMGFLESIGRLENQSLRFSALAAVVFTALAILFSLAWLKRFRRGPLEGVTRRLSG